METGQQQFNNIPQPKLILIGIKHLRLTGVNTYAITLSRYLREKGHIVHIYIDDASDCKGYAGEAIKHITKYTSAFYFGIEPEHVYDEVYSNYTDVFEKLHFYSKLHTFIVHGLHSENYVPPIEADRVICLSKVAYNYIDHPEKVLSVNPVMNDVFDTFRDINKELKRVLLLDVRNGSKYAAKVKQACEWHNIQFRAVKEQDWRIEKQIEWADLVIGYGRCVIEAATMGRNVIVYGVNGGDGFLDAENFGKISERNFSGWELRSMYPPATLCPLDFWKELRKYDAKTGEHLKQLAKQYNYKKVLDEITGVFEPA